MLKVRVLGTASCIEPSPISKIGENGERRSSRRRVLVLKVAACGWCGRRDTARADRVSFWRDRGREGTVTSAVPGASTAGVPPAGDLDIGAQSAGYHSQIRKLDSVLVRKKSAVWRYGKQALTQCINT